jgi:very-short-patch-repair endonuclease
MRFWRDQEQDEDFRTWSERQAREDDRARFEQHRAADNFTGPDNWRKLGDSLLGIYGSRLGNVESAIEKLLADEFPRFAKPCGYVVVPQYELGPFRYDFAIKNDTGTVVAVVECDGRAFHSTAEQRQRDRAKDELARQHGLRMFRYSGRDICSNPAKIAEQIIFHTWPR